MCSEDFNENYAGLLISGIPISGVKQLGTLNVLVKNYRRNSFQKFDPYASLYRFFSYEFFP